MRQMNIFFFLEGGGREGGGAGVGLCCNCIRGISCGKQAFLNCILGFEGEGEPLEPVQLPHQKSAETVKDMLIISNLKTETTVVYGTHASP